MVSGRVLVLQLVHPIHAHHVRVHRCLAGTFFLARSINLKLIHLQRLKTLTEFRTMAVAPYPIQCYRESKWITIQSDELLPGDIVSVGQCLYPLSKPHHPLTYHYSTTAVRNGSPC